MQEQEQHNEPPPRLEGDASLVRRGPDQRQHPLEWMNHIPPPPQDGEAPTDAYLAILDEEEWFKQYGLRGEPHYGDQSYANQQEARERIRHHESYQVQIHDQVFAPDVRAKEEQLRKREHQLQQWMAEDIHIYPSIPQPEAQDPDHVHPPGESDVVLVCNLKILATYSDTVFTMAMNRGHYQGNGTSDSNKSPLQLSLSDYSREGVQAFLDWIHGQEANSDWIQIGLKTLHENIKPQVGHLPADQHVVECCQIAHYLQCNHLLDRLVPLLVASVDEENALSLCQLADQLNLPSLKERSLNVLLSSLKKVEDHQIWPDLSVELQDHIRSIQGILKHNNTKKVFFGSLEEYLALFAEQVDYYRERLEDATRAQESRRPLAGAGWDYAQTKIDQQSQRVEVLRTMLREQKRIFRANASA